MAKRTRVWCCRRCGAPLGQTNGQQLVVHQPHASFFITGAVVAVCRCLERNALTRGQS